MERLDIRGVYNRNVLMMLPPAELTWILSGRERDFSFDYGMLPEAYKTGQTNGVEFIVELRHADAVRRIFHRYLRPVTSPADRNYQQSRVILPPYQLGTSLILRTTPGELNDNAWDWAYVCNIRFKNSSSFLPGQYPSFNRVPDEAWSELGNLYQRNGAAYALGLHAPSRIAYRLTGQEQTLVFSYGFFPGAYQAPNATNGAIFKVTLEEPGAPVKILHEKLLNPVAEPSHRGPQSIQLLIPGKKTGARLSIEIDPNGGNSWDWTYLSRLTLE